MISTMTNVMFCNEPYKKLEVTSEGVLLKVGEFLFVMENG